MTTYVTNLNAEQANVRIKTAEGLAYIYVAPKGRVALAEGSTVDANWLAGNPKIRVSAPDVTPTPTPAP